MSRVHYESYIERGYDSLSMVSSRLLYRSGCNQIRPNSCDRFVRDARSQDMGLVFLTALFDEKRGRWAFTLSDIAKKYSQRWFWIDLVRYGVSVKMTAAGSASGSSTECPSK